MATDRPNVVLIISDQQRAETLGFTGRTPCRTPNLDRLVASGVSFDRAITPCPLCGPARAAMFTGLYPHQARGTAGADLEGGPLEGVEKECDAADMLLNDYSLAEPPLLTDRFRQAGYHTAYAGKWHLGSDVIKDWFDECWGYKVGQYVQWCADNGLPDGWPLHDMATRTERLPHMSIPRAAVQDTDPAHTNDAWIADLAIRYIENRPADKPFFVVCGFNGPHPPLVIPEPYFSMYDPADIPQPPNFGPTPGEPECNRNFYRQLFRDHGGDWAAWRRSYAAYWGFCTLIDHQVGRLVECLDREGVRDNALIVYCSDHGEMLGAHGLWHKMQAYEEALRVPLVFSAPWIAGPHRSDAPASLIDIPSTILAAAGLDVPGEYEGADLTAAFTGRPLPPRPYLFSEHKPLGTFHGGVDWRMVTDGRYKYTWNRGACDELYDLHTDPHELTDLVDTPAAAETLATLRAVLHRWMHETADPLRPDRT